jgi:hypothetical protein
MFRRGRRPVGGARVCAGRLEQGTAAWVGESTGRRRRGWSVQRAARLGWLAGEGWVSGERRCRERDRKKVG